MIDKLINTGTTILESKALTIALSVVLTIAIYFYIDSKTTIADLKEENKALIANNEASKMKVIEERNRCNNNKEIEILNNNNETLKQENERLTNVNNLLKENQEIKDEDNKKINAELNKIKNKKCLQTIVDDATVESLNKIFN